VAPEPRALFDPEAAWAAINKAAQQLVAAEAEAIEINARVARAIRERLG
jgi:hypothetical protein